MDPSKVPANRTANFARLIPFVFRHQRGTLFVGHHSLTGDRTDR